MNNEQIREIALTCGFKLNDTTGETPDLKPYVYHFARKLISAAIDPALTEMRSDIAKFRDHGDNWEAELVEGYTSYLEDALDNDN
tara:strand:- start:574 stop:828 length:255 start_codon:yes stop_codon:yes gene_type:complete